MSEYQKYQHLERLGTSETQGILEGVVHVFPKIDGTNAKIWADPKDGFCRFGSRNRELSIGADNANFMGASIDDGRYPTFFRDCPDITLFGEWLVPHSLKSYRDDAWRKFYVFDVMDAKGYFEYDYYSRLLSEYHIDFVPLLCRIKNPTIENLYDAMKRNTYLLKDGEGIGEGIVIKNYDYRNQYGRQTWAKLVSNEFVEKHNKEMGAPIHNGSLLVEEQIVAEFLTTEFVLKEKAKIENEHEDNWSSKFIGELLGRVFYEFVREESWNFVKKHKNPTVNYKTLQGMVNRKVKEVIGI